jgi:choline dehydrogenase-like flavoprotein
MPVPRVVHKLSQRDLESLHRLHEQIAADLKTMSCGGELIGTPEELANAGWMDAYQYYPDTTFPMEILGTPEELAKAQWRDAFHYLGTTRMGINSEYSVVNPDLRVHTVDNLYVAGGSVFPTSGCANPTMTIVALSIRLAEHLRTTSPHVAWRTSKTVLSERGPTVILRGNNR